MTNETIPLRYKQTHIKKIIKESVMSFIKNDKNDLLKIRIYEPTLSHRIAVYLENKFSDYDVDCEYNKIGKDPKINSKGKKVRPDIIIHKRGIKDNLVVIEIKNAGKNSKKAQSDIKKLKTYFSKQLGFRLGVFIGILKKKVDICYIEKQNNSFKEEWEELRNE